MMTILMKGGNEGIGIPDPDPEYSGGGGYAEKIH